MPCRSFTDALTELIENVIRFRSDLDPHEAEWQAACAQVMAERGGQGEPQADSLQAHLAALSDQKVRALLEQVPAAALCRALKS